MRTTGSYESVGELLLETMSLKCYFGWWGLWWRCPKES
jgi:hypothetical protein